MMDLLTHFYFQVENGLDVGVGKMRVGSIRWQLNNLYIIGIAGITTK